MNWTGGTLQRTKHANKGVMQKQKAYFARARTQLQQSAGTPAAPFRPEYLQEGDDCELVNHLPLLGSDSVRQTGHSVRKRREVDEGHTSQTVHRSRREHDWRRSQDTRPHFAQGKRGNDVREKQPERKREGTANDTEMQLLEINKRRLLRQRDWIGLAPSRPVELQFLSAKGKSRIGRRRKTDERSKAITHRRSPTRFPCQTGEDRFAGHRDFFMTGALPVLTAADNIQVRIGSDALTTAGSTQANSYAQSQTNSDSMLFDEKSEDAAGRLQSEAPRSITHSGHTLAAPTPNGYQPSASDGDHPPQHGPYAHHDVAARPQNYAGARIWNAAAKPHPLDQSIQQSDATQPSYHLTHHVGGVERPLKLVFGDRTPSKISHTALPTDQTGEAQHFHADFNAEENKIGHATRNIGEACQSVIKRHPNSLAIVDDEPWRTCLDIGTSSSSQVRMDNGTGTSVPQPHLPTRNTRADRTSRPQHTIQGNLTHVNLSTAPTSLPVPKWRSGRFPDARPLSRPNSVKDVNEHEGIWQTFALGSDPQSVIDTIHTHKGTSENSTSEAAKSYALTRLPLSNAVTSVNSITFPSPPFRSLSGQASRISDDVQYAPHSETRSITSAAPSHVVWGRIESPDEGDVQAENQGEETPAPSRFGELSTHTSLQNHASHGSELFSGTRTSRSDLDRCDRAWDDASRCAQASGSVVWPRGRISSIWNIPSSDAADIDLVDVDRLT